MIAAAVTTYTSCAATDRACVGDPIDDRFPRWSPDGTKLIFESGRDGLLTAPLSTRRHSDLFVIDADGSHVTNNIRIVFSERMNEGSLSTRVFDLNSPFAGDFVQPSSSAYDTTTNTQTITVKLMSRHVYEVVVGPNFPAKDLAGNELLGSNRFRFTTLDAGPPGAVGFSPDRNAVDVDPATSIRVSFNEALDPATVNATNFTVYRTDGSGTISGSLSYDPATFSVVYKPDQLLQSGKQYGVVVQRLRDATGVDQEGVINYVFTVR